MISLSYLRKGFFFDQNFKIMRILVGCELSQTITIAFRAKGHEAFSCDLKQSTGGVPEWHLKGNVFDYVSQEWDMGIFSPPCTYLTVTANKWLKDQPKRKSGALVGKERRLAKADAYEFFMACWNFPIKKMCLENPIGVMSSLWRKPDQIINPWQFGHKEPKKTCLWLRGLPLLKHTKIVDPEYHITKSGKRLPKWYAYADKSKGQEYRADIRSKTFEGIAKAMAEQWG